MEKLQWIKELVLAEQQMEEKGVVDMTAGFDPDNMLENQTLEFMNDLKAAFIESSSAFNQLKGSSLGQIKIYGISKTQVDFMLFRNGYKLVFHVRQPGMINIRFHTMASSFIPGQTVGEPSQSAPSSEDFLKARWGAFGELLWTYKDHPLNLDYLVRYYMTRFIKESTK